MGVKAKIAPSMLSSDFANLASEAQRMLDCGADWLHMDIMALCSKSYNWSSSDREPEKTYKGIFGLPSYGHRSFCIRGTIRESWCLWFYISCRDNWQQLVEKVKSKGMRPGVSLKPGTPIEEVYPLVEGENPVEMVLVMTVEPGFGGQKFIPEMMDKVRTLRKKYPTLDIEVDGGLGPSTIDAAAEAGANCIVAGSSVFGAPDPSQVISLMRKSVDEAQSKMQ